MTTDIKELGSYAYIEDIISSASKQFPKRCSCCDVEFKGFAEFIDKTYIPEHNESRNIQIIQCEDGAVEEGYILAYRNCACHSTITILCAMEDELKAQLFEAIEKDAEKMGASMETVMELIRDRIVHSSMEN